MSGVGAQERGAANKTLTAVPGIKVGQYTLSERPTGCTVILAESGATAGADVRGAAPATRETDLLEPVDLVQQIHAVVLSGGSAFGLDAATGVMRYLEEKGITDWRDAMRDRKGPTMVSAFSLTRSLRSRGAEMDVAPVM